MPSCSLIRNDRLQQTGTDTVVATSAGERDFVEYNIGLHCLSASDRAYTRSISVAIPWPNPIHIVQSPYWPSQASS